MPGFGGGNGTYTTNSGDKISGTITFTPTSGFSPTLWYEYSLSHTSLTLKLVFNTGCKDVTKYARQ